MNLALQPKKPIKKENIPTGIKNIPKRIWGIALAAMVIISFVIEILSTGFPTYILMILAIIIIVCVVGAIIWVLNKDRKKLIKKHNDLVNDYNRLLKEHKVLKQKLQTTEEELAETRDKLTLIEDELERTKTYLQQIEKELDHRRTAEVKPIFSSGANRYSHWLIWDKYKVWFKNVGTGPAKNVIGRCIYHSTKTDNITQINYEVIEIGQHVEFLAGNTKEHDQCRQITLEFSYKDVYGNQQSYNKRFVF